MEIALRLILAVLFGSIIGLEREKNNHPAGFRTHILVCTGAALITLVSINSFPGGDPGRVAAQIVSGIGFLGAGTIMRDGATIRGLTTAASLWSVAGIGMAIGAGYYFGATLTTVLMIVVLFFFASLERKILQGQYHVLVLTIADVPGQLGRIGSRLGEMGISIRTIQISPGDANAIQADIGIKTPASLELHQVVNGLADVEGVFTIKYGDS